MIFTPENLPIKRSLFLAGTIDNGNSEDWQSKVAKELEEFYNIYNPRTSMTPEQYNDPKVGENQIAWEQKYINSCDVIFFNFLPNSKSPITLLELGYALAKNYIDQAGQVIVVCCPPEYWKYSNVHFMCDTHIVYFRRDFNQAIDVLKNIATHEV